MSRDELYRQYAPEECTGANGYPPAWHAVLKHEVREAAGHRCVRCGHPYGGPHPRGEWTPCDRECKHGGRIRWGFAGGSWVEQDRKDGITSGELLVRNADTTMSVQAAWRILTVHHLDGDKGNCRWWNLVALCQRCHLQVQGRVVMARVWPWEHTSWFRPYVAGYYAWAYLGEDLSRPEVEARMEGLLALERQS